MELLLKDPLIQLLAYAFALVMGFFYPSLVAKKSLFMA